jgi:hypothetical protein
MNNNNSQQHYRLTLESAIAQYQKGWITATALLYYYFKIRLAPGWKITLHQREIRGKLGIPKTSFYRAIENLSQEGLINWESPNGIVVSLPPTGLIPTDGTKSHLWDSIPTNGTLSPIDGTLSPTDGTKTPAKPLPGKASSPSSDSYQILINSLSDSARENFLTFVKEKVKHFNPPINDLEAWLAGTNGAGKERFRVYYEMFQSEVGEAAAPSQEWEKHPLWEQALTAMGIGVPRFIVKGEPNCEDIDPQTRRRMADYAKAKNLIRAVKP